MRDAHRCDLGCRQRRNLCRRQLINDVQLPGLELLQLGIAKLCVSVCVLDLPELIGAHRRKLRARQNLDLRTVTTKCVNLAVLQYGDLTRSQGLELRRGKVAELPGGPPVLNLICSKGLNLRCGEADNGTFGNRADLLGRQRLDLRRRELSGLTRAAGDAGDLCGSKRRNLVNGKADK